MDLFESLDGTRKESSPPVPPDVSPTRSPVEDMDVVRKLVESRRVLESVETDLSLARENFKILTKAVRGVVSVKELRGDTSSQPARVSGIVDAGSNDEVRDIFAAVSKAALAAGWVEREFNPPKITDTVIPSSVFSARWVKGDRGRTSLHLYHRGTYDEVVLASHAYPALGEARVKEGERAKLETFQFLLKHKLTSYDRKMSAKPLEYNKYALGHYMKAVQNIERECKSAGVWTKTTPDAYRKYIEIVRSNLSMPLVDRFAEEIESYIANPQADFKLEAADKGAKQKYYSGYQVGQADKGKGLPQRKKFAGDDADWYRGYTDAFSGKDSEVKSPMEFLEALPVRKFPRDALRRLCDELLNRVVGIRDGNASQKEKVYTRDLWKKVATELDVWDVDSPKCVAAYSTISFLLQRAVEASISLDDARALQHAVVEIAACLSQIKESVEKVTEGIAPAVGMRVAAIDGPGQFPTKDGAANTGTIVGKRVTQWGTSWKVEMDDDTTDFIDQPGGLMAPTERGIGWYVLKESVESVEETGLPKGEYWAQQGKTPWGTKPSDGSSKKASSTSKKPAKSEFSTLTPAQKKQVMSKLKLNYIGSTFRKKGRGSKKESVEKVAEALDPTGVQKVFDMVGANALGKQFMDEPAARPAIAFAMGAIVSTKLGHDKGSRAVDLLLRFTDLPLTDKDRTWGLGIARLWGKPTLGQK